MSRRKSEKQSFWNQKNIMSIFIVLIMTTSVMAFMFSGSTINRTEYNGHTIKQVTSNEGETHYEVKGESYQFSYPPESMDSLAIDDGVMVRLSATDMLSVTYNETSSFVEDFAVLQLTLIETLGERNTYVEAALTDDNPYGVPVRTCEHATVSVPVIVLSEGEQPGITIDGDCLTLTGRGQGDFLLLTEAIMYGMLGVIE
ncbi:MAG: hypothetical protein ABIC95_03705 [archaeon]